MFNIFRRNTRKPIATTEKALQVSQSAGFKIDVEDNTIVKAEVFDIGDAVKSAAIENVANAPDRPFILANRYSVETHLKTAADMMRGLEARKARLLDEERISTEEYEAAEKKRREDFERANMDARSEHAASVSRRAGELDEIERLMRFYGAAEALTAPETTSKFVRLEPAAGDKIAATKRNARRRKPIENAN